MTPRWAYRPSNPKPSTLRPAPNERPRAKPVRESRLPGRIPRLDTLPYERPPFSAMPDCADRAAAAPSVRAVVQASMRFMVRSSSWEELHRGSDRRFRVRGVQIATNTRSPLNFFLCGSHGRSEEHTSEL